jgi:hypothetical protein
MSVLIALVVTGQAFIAFVPPEPSSVFQYFIGAAIWGWGQTDILNEAFAISGFFD